MFEVMGSSSFVAATQLHDLAMELEEAARAQSVRGVVPSRQGNRPGNRLHPGQDGEGGARGSAALHEHEMFLADLLGCGKSVACRRGSSNKSWWGLALYPRTVLS